MEERSHAKEPHEERGRERDRQTDRQTETERERSTRNNACVMHDTNHIVH